MKNLDSFDSFVLPSAGKHSCKVTDYEVATPDEGQPYILVTLLGKDCAPFQTRLYSARVPYFMSAMARQTSGLAAGMRLSELLEYLSSHDFDLWVSYSEKYGLQVNYSEPRK